MYNQQVEYATGAWTYSPLKYWPNETVGDPQAATGVSAATDKLSFFAYAPYVSGTPSGTGIDGMIANTAKDIDPWVSYTVATDPSQSVDLLWGVAPAGGLSYPNVAGGTTTVSEGMPLMNLIKPAKDQKIKFLFQHALARIGLTVVYAADQISAGGALDAQTKIAVKEVSIIEEASPLYRLATSGKLNLNNTTKFQSLWSDKDGIFSATIPLAGLNPNIAYKTNASDTWGQTGDWTGVTNVETDVIKDKKYFMVIPGHIDTDLKVTITYDVITKDDKVATGYSEVENVITKKITVSKLTNNKAYNLKLILGMTSVKLDAEVADWQVDGSNEVYLPQNKE